MSVHVDALEGYTVGITADRRRDEQAWLFECRGARVLHGPTIRTVPLADDAALELATRAIIEDPPDVVVLTTGYGARTWMEVAESRGMGDGLLGSLSRSQVMTRGLESMAAAVMAGVDVAWNAPSSRSIEIVEHLKATSEPHSRIVVQLDGSNDDRLIGALQDAGFDVMPMPVYRWAFPEDVGPALRVVNAACDGSIDAVTFTKVQALRNLFSIADQVGRVDDLTDAFRAGRVSAVCIGPACAQVAAEHEITAVVPQSPRLGAMVHAYASSLADRSVQLTLAGIPVMIQGRLVTVDGQQPVALSDRERDVLEVLARKPGAVVPKSALMREVWGGGEGNMHIVEVTIARLRQRLGPADLGIETVVRRGYRLSSH